MEKTTLLRFKEKDGLNGISKATFDRLVKASGISGNSLIHLGLVELVKHYLPEVYRDMVNAMEEEQPEGDTTSQPTRPDIIINNSLAFRRQFMAKAPEPLYVEPVEDHVSSFYDNLPHNSFAHHLLYGKEWETFGLKVNKRCLNVCGVAQMDISDNKVRLLNRDAVKDHYITDHSSFAKFVELTGLKNTLSLPDFVKLYNTLPLKPIDLSVFSVRSATEKYYFGIMLDYHNKKIFVFLDSNPGKYGFDIFQKNV